MTDRDVIQMAQRCIEEIKTLRAQVAELAPKAHAYDSISQVLDLLPKPSQGYGEDIVWRLQKQIDELRAEPAASSTVEDIVTVNP